MVHSDNKMMARSPPLQIVVVLLSRILLTRAVDTGGINDGGGSAYGMFLFYYKAKTQKIFETPFTLLTSPSPLPVQFMEAIAKRLRKDTQRFLP